MLTFTLPPAPSRILILGPPQSFQSAISRDLIMATVEGKSAVIVHLVDDPGEGIVVYTGLKALERARGKINENINVQLLPATHSLPTERLIEKITALQSEDAELTLIRDFSRSPRALTSDHPWIMTQTVLHRALHARVITIASDSHLPNQPSLDTGYFDATYRIENGHSNIGKAGPTARVGEPYDVRETSPGNRVLKLKGSQSNGLMIFRELETANV
jgi:hypothetical protein